MTTKTKKSLNDPKLVGFWVVAVTKQKDLIKWGKDGDVIYPYTTKIAVNDQIKYLQTSPLHRGDRFYVLNVFSNGQIRTDEVD